MMFRRDVAGRVGLQSMEMENLLSHKHYSLLFLRLFLCLMTGFV